MAVTCWFYRSFANSFTLCLIGSFVLQALLAVFWPVFPWSRRARLTANSERENSVFHTHCLSSQHTAGEEKNGAADTDTDTDTDARSASKPDQAEREAVGERRVEPTGLRHCLLTADQRTQGPAKRWPVRAFSSNPLPIPRQLSLVTFFFARKESYPPPGRRSPLNPQKNPPKAKAKANQQTTQQ